MDSAIQMALDHPTTISSVMSKGTTSSQAKEKIKRMTLKILLALP